MAQARAAEIMVGSNGNGTYDDSAYSGKKGDLENSVNTVGTEDIAPSLHGEKVVVSKKSSHGVGTDGPWICAFHEFAALDNAFILGYPFLIYWFLDWWWGSFLIGGFGIFSYYIAWELAGLHEYGGKRQIRLRDLTANILGRWTYYPVWILQFANLVLGNIGLVILAGESLKLVHDRYNMNQNIKLSEWSAISGFICALFTFCVPHLHHLRVYSGISVILIFIFSIIALAISIHDRRKNGAPCYGISGGGCFAPDPTASKPAKTFNALGALGTIAFSYNNVILPEIQATVKAPAIRNFRMAVTLYYTFAMSLWILVTVIGYWSYGAFVEVNLLLSLSGPDWAVSVASIAAFLQIIVSVQIYANPIYELLDTKLGDFNSGTWSAKNTLVRIISRGLYWALTTFLAILLPYFGDFVPLAGSLSVFPIIFSATLVMTAMVQPMNPIRKYAHYIGAVITFLTGIASAIASVRYIVVDAQNYSVFANLAG